MLAFLLLITLICILALLLRFVLLSTPCEPTSPFPDSYPPLAFEEYLSHPTNTRPISTQPFSPPTLHDPAQYRAWYRKNCQRLHSSASSHDNNHGYPCLAGADCSPVSPIDTNMDIVPEPSPPSETSTEYLTRRTGWSRAANPLPNNGWVRPEQQRQQQQYSNWDRLSCQRLHSVGPTAKIRFAPSEHWWGHGDWDLGPRPTFS